MEGGTTTAIETALNLKATVGFPYSDYKYDVFDWDSELDYDKFIEYGSTASSISGKYYDSREEERYETTIILYNGRYYVQVETDWDYGSGTAYSCNSFPDYLSSLKYAHGVVFN